MTQLDDFALFVELVRAGSLTRAARELDIPKSTISRRLANFEDALSQRLVQRNSRALTLTDAGKDLFDAWAPVVAQARELQCHWTSRPERLAGRVKVTATEAFGVRFVMPLVAKFLAEHPHVHCELTLTDRAVDLVAEGFDLAIRMGKLETSGLVHRPLATIPRVLCAAPSYVKSRPALRDASDLRSWERVVTCQGNSWTFEDARVSSAASTMPTRLVTSHLGAVHAAVLRGVGIGLLPAFLVTDDLDAGALELVLPRSRPMSGAGHVLWPSNRHLAPQTRTFIDLLVSCAGSDPALGGTAEKRVAEIADALRH